MRASSTAWLLGGGAVVWAATTVLMATGAPRHPTLPNMLVFPDASGHFRTYSASGAIDLGNPFFQSLGTNGRSCSTCHQPSDAWSVTPDHIQTRFDETGGLDPIFRSNDGSVSPLADIASVTARRAAFRMLLSKGLIRVGIGVSDSAEFRLIAVDDPYGFASATELSLFRRPLPATNLGFLCDRDVGRTRDIFRRVDSFRSERSGQRRDDSATPPARSRSRTHSGKPS